MSCLMNFGELNIPSSRAFWDDCDEDDENQLLDAKEKLQLTYEAGQSAEIANNVDLLIIIEGFHVIEFADKTLLNHATKVCAIPAEKSAMHVIEDDKTKTLIAVIVEDLSSSGEITELLLPYIKQAQRVITLNIKSKVDYKTENLSSVYNVITFLRGINSQLTHVAELEAPNFIAGVAAGVASWRENAGLPVSSYIAYTDNVALDSVAVKPILQLLHDLHVNCATSYTPKLRDDKRLYS